MSTAGPSSALGKRKEPPDGYHSSGHNSRDTTPTPGASEGNAGESRTKKQRKDHRKKAKTKKSPGSWHMPKGKVPEGAQTIKLALQTHVRALATLPTQDSIPSPVSNAEKAPFFRRFSSRTQIETTVASSLEANAVYANEARRRARTFLTELPETGTYANNIRRIGEAHLQLMFQSVASIGLPRWAPDILSDDAESMYNLLHEHIALKTFNQVAIAGGYNHMAINLSFLNQTPLMRRLYRSFLFSYIRNIARLEAKKGPGTVANVKKLNSTFKRRKELANNRVLDSSHLMK